MAKKIKAKGTSRNPGGGNPLAGASQAGMLARIQKMQEEMAQAQQSLENETMDVSVGGGAVVITITGHQRVQAVKIDKESLDMEDEDWLTDLQDLLAAAFNQAVEQSQAMAAERMEGITGGLDTMLPGGLGGLFG